MIWQGTQDMKNERKKSFLGISRCVAVALRHDRAKVWIRSYFANGNTIPLAIYMVPGPWEEGEKRLCSEAARHSGGIVAGEVASKGSCPELVLAAFVSRELGPDAWMMLDDRSEVVGCLDECLDYAAGAPGFVLSRFVSVDSIDNTHPERIEDGRFCHPSPVIFHGDANRRISDDMADCGEPDLHSALLKMYETSPAWHDGFCDFTIRRWVLDADSFLKDRRFDGKVVCYSEEAARDWASGCNAPKAPFEDNPVAEIDSGEGPVDAVFVIGTGSVDNNEELRYALRNLEKHCKFIRDVYISGYCPPWVDKSIVKHLNWPDRFGHAKDANIIDKLRHACEHRGIAKKILFCSDDQFQTRECSWADFKPRFLRQYFVGDRWYDDKHRIWHTRLRKTLEREVARRKSAGMDASKVFYYQPHIWMPIDRDRFIDYARWCNYETRDDTIIASGYFNFVDADGVKDFDHTFIGSADKDIPKVTHLAYHDGSEKAAMRMLRNMFPEKSRFETSGNGRDSAPAPNVASKPEKIKDGVSVIPGNNPSPATEEELSDIRNVINAPSRPQMWPGLAGEISRAEELRLFGVRGWRTVWSDIVRRWKEATYAAKDAVRPISPRSEAADAVIKAYTSAPGEARNLKLWRGSDVSRRYATSFGRQLPRPAPDTVMGRLRDKIRSLRDGRKY